MKTCQKCNEVKDLDQFHKHKVRHDGLNAWCKSCVKEYQKKNKWGMREAARRYYNKKKAEAENKI